jgi:hypothetical protein
MRHCAGRTVKKIEQQLKQKETTKDSMLKQANHLARGGGIQSCTAILISTTSTNQHQYCKIKGIYTTIKKQQQQQQQQQQNQFIYTISL